MNKSLRTAGALTVTLLLLGGCAGGVSTNTEINPGPVGIGKSVNELKGTPCACTEIPMQIPGALGV